MFRLPAFPRRFFYCLLMTPFRVFGVLSAALLFSVLTAARCTAGAMLIVAASASVSAPVKEIARSFEAEEGVTVVVSSASSGKLASQIENGAPFDIFLSADTSYVQRLKARGLVKEGTVKVFARGRIVLVIGKNSFGVDGIGDLVKGSVKRISIANPSHAPYGRAALQAIKGAGLFKRIRHKLVYGENVRQALQFVETGNAQAGIVALSVVRKGSSLRFIAVDPSIYEPVKHTAAILERTKRTEDAKRFLGYLKGPAGRRVLESYGLDTR